MTNATHPGSERSDPVGEDSRSKGLTLPVIGLALAMVFVGLSLWYRTSQQASPPPAGELAGTSTGTGPDVDQAQARFEQMLANESEAFRTTCSLCHEPPSPKLYDEEGWLGIGRKMKERMAERMDVAILHQIRQARPGVEFEPLAELERTGADRPTRDAATQPARPGGDGASDGVHD